MRAGANFVSVHERKVHAVRPGAIAKAQERQKRRVANPSGKQKVSAGRIRAALDGRQPRGFGERLHELGRSARVRRSRRQMQQDLSNDFVVGNERDHAELAAALTLQGVGKIDPSNEARPASSQSGALLR